MGIQKPNPNIKRLFNTAVAAVLSLPAQIIICIQAARCSMQGATAPDTLQGANPVYSGLVAVWLSSEVLVETSKSF